VPRLDRREEPVSHLHQPRVVAVCLQRLAHGDGPAGGLPHGRDGALEIVSRVASCGEALAADDVAVGAAPERDRAATLVRVGRVGDADQHRRKAVPLEEPAHRRARRRRGPGRHRAKAERMQELRVRPKGPRGRGGRRVRRRPRDEPPVPDELVDRHGARRDGRAEQGREKDARHAHGRSL
jgi:hypothetical protein